MPKVFKSILYIIGCVAVFLILVKVYDGSTPYSNTANAFEWEKQVQVYFIDKKIAETTSCEAGVPLKRTVLNAETLGPGAIEALIKGLTSEEVQSGKYYSSINSTTLLQRFEIIDKVAYVDFNASLNEGVGGACQIQAIKSQIENTLNNLSDIDRVVISIDGETEGILEP